MIRGHKFISEKEERRLLVLYKENGDRAALDELIKSNQGFVYNMAYAAYKRYIATTNGSGSTLELDDIINTGNVALCTAIEKYDTKRKTRLLTYAGYWIKAYINQQIEKEVKTNRGLVDIDNVKNTKDDYIEDAENNEIDNLISIRHMFDKYKLNNVQKLFICYKLDLLAIPLTLEDIENITFTPLRPSDIKRKIKSKLSKISPKI